VSEGFALRAPWYVRERGGFDLRDPRALRPTIQMYDSTRFMDEVMANPADSLAFGLDDRWSYPVPVTPGGAGTGIRRFATSRLVHTRMRKLYQPSHNRFYLVVVEVFCDVPGLPRAGSHRDIAVTMVMRRRHTSTAAGLRPVRKLAKALMSDLAREQLEGSEVGTPDLDVGDLLFAHEAERDRFELDHGPLIEALGATHEEWGWVPGHGGGWREAPAGPAGALPIPDEEQLPMFRLPPRPGCDPDRTRSLWCGLVPTYSSDHWTDKAGDVRPKLDDRSIYEMRCVVTQAPAPGHEHCPPKQFASSATRPFRLAAALDPDGTKNRTISITAPDLRRLAAHATRKPGTGGLRITTPPGSGLGPVDFKKIPSAGASSPKGGPICTFAFELFFIVALFLFLLFLPIVVLLFQLWWMLALRFCIPPSLAFSTVEQFFAGIAPPGPKRTLADVVPGSAVDEALGEVLGVPAPTAALRTPGSQSLAEPDLVVDLVDAIDPTGIEPSLPDPRHLPIPPDPLCDAGATGG